MHCLFFVFASLFLCEVSAEAESIDKIIQDYFNSSSVDRFRREWENHREPIELAIRVALRETVGSSEINVYVRGLKEKLAAGFFHNDKQVRVILSDITLQELTVRCGMPKVKLSLASNTLKIQTTLSSMTICAEYALLRNKSDVINVPYFQNPFESSPFLFGESLDVGRVTITIDSCSISGFIMTTLSDDSVKLGYDHFKLLYCFYIVKIYRPGFHFPPVFAPYNLSTGDGRNFTDFLMKPLVTELVSKLQAAMFRLVNTSALFGNELLEHREKQEIFFKATDQYLTELIRNSNKITIKKNRGIIQMEDYTVYWDDGRIKPSNKNQNRGGESIMLKDMVLTGLDMMYSTHSGGPYIIDTVMIAEEIRFSSLQVRGKLVFKSSTSNEYPFATELSDMTVDLHIGQSWRDKENTDDRDKPTKNHGFQLVVKGFRCRVITAPALVHESAESLIGGYLLNAVPKLIESHLTDILPEALHPAKASLKAPRPEESDSKEERDVLEQNKKRFKSTNHTRRRHAYSKRVANNEIRQK